MGWSTASAGAWRPWRASPRSAGNYPSKGGIAELGAWFRDNERNLLGIAEPIRSEL